MPVKKLLLAAFIATMVMLYFFGDGQTYLRVNFYQDLYKQSPMVTIAVFFTIFLIGTSCSLPVTGALSVASGVVFGTLMGAVIALVAATLGGTVAFFSTRYLFRELIQRRFGTQLEVVNRGIKKEGAFYLFGLRMIPVIPFWLLNLILGLSDMRLPVFMLATLCGMVPIILILAYTGNQLGSIETFSMMAIFSPGLIAALCLLAGFPLLARLLIGFTRRHMSKQESA